MTDFHELMRAFSIPRPNGSQALTQTCETICAWLDAHHISYRRHTFRIFPYLLETFGAWLILSQVLLFMGFWMHWGWPTLVIAGVGLGVMILEMLLNIPITSRIGACQGTNILMEFNPPAPRQTLVVSAHYDSKTELLDHHKRALFMDNIPLAMVAMLVLGVLGVLDKWMSEGFWTQAVFYSGAFLSAPQFVLMAGLGVNILTGRLVKSSQGAVDNGAACAILLDVARRLAKGEIPLKQTRVVVAIFTGEEIAMQGSRAYVSDHNQPLPTTVLNLEIMAQDGAYIIWNRDGSPIDLHPTPPDLNAQVADVVAEVTGHPAKIVQDHGGTDVYPFLKAGIPATSLATYDTRFKDGGLHRPTDNLARVKMDRLPEGVAIVRRFIERFDEKERMEN